MTSTPSAPHAQAVHAVPDQDDAIPEQSDAVPGQGDAVPEQGDAVAGRGRAGPDRELRFRGLVEDHFRELVGYAVRRVGSPDDAADIVAETMMVAWRRIDEVPADDRARLWLYGVARRVLANHRRGQLRRQRLSERLNRQLVEVMPDPADAADSVAAVRQALAGLSDDDRELIMLTAWDGLDPREAAVVLDVPARTIRTRLHRARARLRRQLGDAFDADGHVLSDQSARPVQEER